MATNNASARPRKRFFVEMFTRDLSLTDCLLDLIDNSIDGLIRRDGLDLGISLFDTISANPTSPSGSLPKIEVAVSDRRISIKDNCGGISFDEAMKNVFNFGHSQEYSVQRHGARLGAYGIGLKRAMFKIGNTFEMDSRYFKSNGFKMKVALDSWVAKDQALKDWAFPITKVGKAKSKGASGVSIKITQLRKEVITAVRDGKFEYILRKAVAKTYALFLNKHVTVTINGQPVEPIDIPFGSSDVVKPGIKKLSLEKVKVCILAGLMGRNKKGQWKAEDAGWYISCNGRLVMAADKSEITGWGGGALPRFVSKYRGFVGLAIFQSNDPLLLPWTTTKRGLNQESSIYQKARDEMRALARPILTFLDTMYPSEQKEEPISRDIANDMSHMHVSALFALDDSAFDIKKTPPRKPRKANIAYSVEKSIIDRIKKHLNRPNINLKEIGLFTLNYYLNSEGIE